MVDVFANAFPGLDGIYVINLAERDDRRREMAEQFAKLGISWSTPQVKLYTAVRPDSVGDWPSLGAKGCFTSHYEIIRQAFDQQMSNVLILEDDCDFSQEAPTRLASQLQHLNQSAWDIAYLGHTVTPAADDQILEGWFQTRQPIPQTHCYLVNRSIMPALLNFCEQVMQRPGGHPDGGPQHYDGALNTFFFQNPGCVVKLSAPSMGEQRSSRSDISTGRMDQLPVMRTVWNTLRTVKKRLSKRGA